MATPKFIRLSSSSHPDRVKTQVCAFVSRDGIPFTLVEFEKTIPVTSAGPHVLHVRRIFADTKFYFSVNGVHAGFGPVSAGGDFENSRPLPKQYFNSYDVPFAEDRLTITVRAYTPCEVMTDTSCGVTGFFFDAITDDGTEIVSDSSWRVRLESRYMHITTADLTLPEPPWETPEVIAEENCPWHLTDPKMPSVTEEEIKPSSVRIEDRGNERITHFDFSRIYSAFMIITVEAENTAELCITLGELFAPPDKVYEWYKVPAGSTTIRDMRMNSIGAVAITAPKSCKVQLSLSYAHYPVNSSRTGTFTCSDEMLNRIYEVGKFTLEMCRQSMHLDSPQHQEPLACTGDYAIEAMMTRMTFGDERVTRLDLIRTADYLAMNDGRMFHTTYSLIWVTMLREYLLFTDDRETLSGCLPALKILLDRFRGQIGPRGVIDSPTNCMFIDWGELDGFSMHHPPLALGQTSLNAFWQGALAAASELYGIAGNQKESARCAAEAMSHKAAFREAFWDKDVACFRDGFKKSEKDYEPYNWYSPNPEKTYHTRHANTLAVLYGLSDGEEARNLMNRVLTEESMDGTTVFQIQPYFMYYVIGAAIKTGLFPQYAQKVLHMWDSQIEKTDMGMREGWGDFNGDCSHAWGAAPTYYLPACITGFKMLEPAYRRFSLSPDLLGLSWAKATIPTPFGMISVKLDGNKREIKVPGQYDEMEPMVYVLRPDC